MVEKARRRGASRPCSRSSRRRRSGTRPAAAGAADALPARRSPEFEAERSVRRRSTRRRSAAIEAGRAAFAAKIEALDAVRDDEGRLRRPAAALVMLNVLDEKWKDHLYDLDQLRNAIHYRSWGQKDPLHRVQAGGVHDVRGPDERHRQHVHRAVPQGAAGVRAGPAAATGAAASPSEPPAPPAPTQRYNALGVLEDVVPEARSRDRRRRGRWTSGPAETPDAREAAAARRDPVIVGAGRARSLERRRPQARPAPVDWSNVGRNDPCPCGSGKKFKKCHGATL